MVSLKRLLNHVRVCHARPATKSLPAENSDACSSLYMPKRHPAATEQVSIVVGDVVALKTTFDLLHCPAT